MRIEFGEIQVGEVARRHLMDCCDKNRVSGGEKVALLEEKWSDLFNYNHSVAVSSGTDAVLNACLTLYDLGAERGDEIIVPALSFIATSNAVLAAGFTPVFADVYKETLNINPYEVQKKLTEKTRAVIAVHTMGHVADMARLDKIVDDYEEKHGRSLILIEDACEAHGARQNGLYVGQLGDMACFSFYVAHLVCCGEGGMVSTMRPDIADILRSTRSHGRKNGALWFDHVRHGMNSKMNDLEASIGLEQIDKFWDTFFRRKNNLYWLLSKLERQYEDKVIFNQKENPSETFCPHALTITFRDNDPARTVAVVEFLDRFGIHAKRNFGSIPTQHQAFSWMGHKLGSFPCAEHIGDNGIHLGVHQYLTQEDLEYMVEVIGRALNMYS